MPPKLPEPWLTDFLQAEISAVIRWKQELLQGVKADPESRFSDDGSNFRSHVATPPATAIVQLMEVLSSHDAVIAYVSDGSWKVKARFSAEALATFEEETGAPVTTEVKGDVFQMASFTVISTPFGPPDSFIQLDVDEIVYKSLRRNALGTPPSVELQYDLRTLIESTKALRMPATAVDDAGSQSQTISSSPPVARKAATISTLPGQRATVAQQGPVARPAKHKSPAPTLNKDGFEVESGVNLHAPVQPITKGKQDSFGSRKEINPALLGLLGTKAVTLPSKTAVAAVEHDLQTQLPATSQKQLGSAARASPVREPVICEPKKSVRNPPSSTVIRETPVKPDHHDTAFSGASPAARQEIAYPAPGSTTGTQGRFPDAGLILFKYARRKIPDNQRKLLDNPASWLPSLPGKRFPAPNVPMELLIKWNKEAECLPEKLPPSRQSYRQSPQQPSSPPAEPLQTPTDSEDSDGTVQEFTPSPSKNWGARLAAMPPASSANVSDESDVSCSESSNRDAASPGAFNRLDFPPSSALGSVIRGTPQDANDLEVTAPHTLAFRSSPKKRKAKEIQPPPAKRHALPPKPAVIAAGSVVGDFGSHGDSGYSNSPAPSRGRHPRLGTAPESVRTRRPDRFDPVTGPPIGPLSGISRNHAASSPARCPLSSEMGSQAEGVNRTARGPGSPRISQPATPSASAQPQTRGQPRLPPSGPKFGSPQEYRSAQPTQTPPTRTPGLSERSAWLKRNLIASKSGTIGLPAVLRQYQHAFPEDKSIEADDMLYAARYAFNDISITEDMKYVANRAWSQKNAIRHDHEHRADPSRPMSAFTQQETPVKVPSASKVAHEVERPLLDPGALHRQARSKFMKEEQRKGFLKSKYVPANNGMENLGTILTHYRQTISKDGQVTLHDLISAARAVFRVGSNSDRITVNTRFASLESLMSSHEKRNVAKDAREVSSEPEALKLQRTKWLQESYEPTRDGPLQLATVLARYQNACPGDESVSFEKFITAAQAAYPLRRVTSGMNWAPRSRGTDLVKPWILAQKPGFVDKGTIGELCVAYLALRSGNGNAFGEERRGKETHTRVDVLNWNI